MASRAWHAQIFLGLEDERQDWTSTPRTESCTRDSEPRSASLCTGPPSSSAHEPLHVSATQVGYDLAYRSARARLHLTCHRDLQRMEPRGLTPARFSDRQRHSTYWTSHTTTGLFLDNLESAEHSPLADDTTTPQT